MGSLNIVLEDCVKLHAGKFYNILNDYKIIIKAVLNVLCIVNVLEKRLVDLRTDFSRKYVFLR